jgi:hypothetical protein
MRLASLLALCVLASCGGRSALLVADGGARDSRPVTRDRARLADVVPGREGFAPVADLDPGIPTCAGDRDCDGVPDASDCAPDDPAVGGCTTYYLDADGDGYGSSASCRCKPGGGYVGKGGDCYEVAPRGKLVHPGQTAFFEDGRGDGSYDYDCDGKETKEHGKYACEAKPWPAAGCLTVPGFKFNAACGVLAEFVYACFFNPGPVSCEAGIQLKTQACR